MGASAAEIPTSPDEQPAPGLRASDAERDEVAARLRDEYVAGRLSHDTFVYRMNAVLESRQQADLPPLVADLPAPPPSRWAARLRPARSRSADPAPGQPRPGRSPAQYQSPQYQSPQPAAVPALVDWLRGAWSRATGQAPPGGSAGYAGRSAGAAAGPRERWTGPRPATPARTMNAGGALVRGTMGMISASGDPNSPLSLRFPRGGGGEFSIGRDASCDLAIADMTVSRRHATLERTADGWLLCDLESTNGTRVNGWRVRGKIAVRAGDLISFGNLVAVFAQEDAVPPGAVSPESAQAPDRP